METTVQKIEIKNNYAPAPTDTTQNYWTGIEFDPETGVVSIEETWQNAQSMRSFHHLDVGIYSHKGASAANVNDVVEYLESDEAQELLRIVQANHSVRWDGNNHVGGLTEDGQAAIGELEAALERIFENLPTLWSASDAYGGAALLGARLWREIAHHGDLETAVAEEIKASAPDVLMEEDDVRSFFQYQLEKYREELRYALENDEADEDAAAEIAAAIEAFLAAQPARSGD